VRSSVPEVQRSVVAGAGELVAVGRERHRAHTADVALEGGAGSSLAGSHSRTDRSPLAPASSHPSEENAIALTEPVCPRRMMGGSSPRDQALALVPFYAGARIAETVAFDVDDVRLSAR
jgi:hypothetical protein